MNKISWLVLTVIGLLLSNATQAQSFSSKTLLLYTSFGRQPWNQSVGIGHYAGHPRWIPQHPMPQQYRAAAGRHRKCRSGLIRMNRSRHWVPGKRNW